MENMTDFVSFWGGIASLAGLAITMICASIAMLRWGRKRREAEFSRLAMIRNTIAERARSATTQGKRMDLFIYYQSLLSRQRFAQTAREIHAATLHTTGAIFIATLLLLDANADYYLDRSFPQSEFMLNNFHYFQHVIIASILFINILLGSVLAKERRQLNESASGLTDELQNYLENIK